MTIDLQASHPIFFVTPGDPKKDLPLSARTTSEFLEEFQLQLAINGDFFEPWHSDGPFDYYPHRGEPVKVEGYAMSNGVTYSTGSESRSRSLRFSQNNRASFSMPLADAYSAISGRALVTDGVAIGRLHGSREPRTAIGLDKNEQTLHIWIVDGRQPNYSEGMTLAELAELAIRSGAWNAINLDGGGSTALVVSRAAGKTEVLNSPIHTRIPTRERPVANHLGVRFSARE